jgi:hypothetical protein
MGSALNAGAVIASAPRVAAKLAVPRGAVVAVPALECSAPESASPPQDDSGGDDSEPPSPIDFWLQPCPTLVCPGLGLFTFKE